MGYVCAHIYARLYCITDARVHNVVMETATDLIKKLRAAGLKQTEIARRTSIPQFRLSRWEAKGAPPAANDVLKLAHLLKLVQAEQHEAATSTAANSANGATQAAAA